MAPRSEPIRHVAEGRDTVFRIASQREELEAALELVYRAYVRSGLTKENLYAMRVTPYHALPTTEVFVAVERGKVICTTTLVRDGELGLPMESIYEHEIAWLRQRGRHLAEVSCLADDRQGEDNSFSVVLSLMALMAQCARQRGTDMLTVVVHPHHAKFYQRACAFEPLGEEKSYGAVCGKPAVALALDLDRLPYDYPAHYRRFFSRPFPEEMLRYRPISRTLQSELEFLARETYDVHRSEPSEVALACA